jgi:RNA polymerase sigma factor (TIGR02999 family)
MSLLAPNAVAVDFIIAYGAHNVSEPLRKLWDRNGDKGEPRAADELLPLVYGELRRLAAARIGQQVGRQTLQATALVHEAWLRLSAGGNREWNGSKHFYCAAAEAMRHILIDRARKKQRVRHGRGLVQIDLGEVEIAAPIPSSGNTLLALDEALEELERRDFLKARIVKLRFFVGLSEEEIAEQLDISERTVKRHWAYAKAWLFERIGRIE